MYLASEDAETCTNKNWLNQKKTVKEYHPACVHLCGCFQSDKVLTVKERDKESKNVCAYRIWTIFSTDSRGLVSARRVCACVCRIWALLFKEWAIRLAGAEEAFHNPTAQLQKLCKRLHSTLHHSKTPLRLYSLSFSFWCFSSPS